MTTFENPLPPRLSHPIAFVHAENTAFYSSLTERKTNRPESPLTTLIQGLYQKHPDQARKILRNRIYCNFSIGAMDWGMIKVAAKKYKVIDSRDLAESRLLDQQQAQRIEYQCSSHEFSSEGFDPQMPMQYAYTLARQNSLQNPKKYERDRAIAALLVSKDGELLLSAINQNSKNKTLHAEVNLVQGYYIKTGNRLPVGSKIVTTLKPCRMCAGMIWEAAEDIRRLTVLYGTDDLGPGSQGTVLDAGSDDRKRLGLSPDLLNHTLQYLDGSQ